MNEDDEYFDYYDVGRDLWENRLGECVIYYVSWYGYLEILEVLIFYCVLFVLEKMFCECCCFDCIEVVVVVLVYLFILVDVLYSGVIVFYFVCGNINIDLV